MTKHKNLEKQFMLDLQGRLPSCRVYRFDNGTAYAVHSVAKALSALAAGRGMVEAKKELIRFTYGNEGWPDLLAGHQGRALGIEVKIGKDKQRDTQKSMELAFSKMGWGYYLLSDNRDYQTQLDEVCQMLSRS